ncbi:hypothetical protein GXP67_30790 [Rhodocytophaga rosea]|uniref:Uncharacterized protein n=1 Tax=Rhodocytophaga rosea TaxID=2704465 RepID=A0A6C0GS97_9BACT|nr:hypothetical protein [Rhodocytophaga rosea]QHT70724.1 hypothetical protein GXP67_30790 [Rhodocytophaga rosea]
MKDNHRRIKTYISEANQNRISETLSVEVESQASFSAENQDSTESSSLKQPETHLEIYDEPEALSAPLTPLPPTTAAYDAEAVAGFTIGETYGDQEDYYAKGNTK